MHWIMNDLLLFDDPRHVNEFLDNLIHRIMNDLLLLDDLRHVNEFLHSTLHSTLRWCTSSKHIVTPTQCEYRFDPKGPMQSAFADPDHI